MSPAEFFSSMKRFYYMFILRARSKYQYKHLNETNDCMVFIFCLSVDPNTPCVELTDFMTTSRPIQYIRNDMYSWQFISSIIVLNKILCHSLTNIISENHCVNAILYLHLVHIVHFKRQSLNLILKWLRLRSVCVHARVSWRVLEVPGK